MTPLLDAAQDHDLDVQIRDEYINIYHGGLSVLQLRRYHEGRYVAEIDRNLVGGVTLPGERCSAGRRAAFNVGFAFVEQYLRQLQVLTRNADARIREERAAEGMLVRNSVQANSPMVIIDRQVSVTGVKGIADVVGVVRSGDPRFIIGEVKYGLNNDIQNIPEQVGDYYNTFTEPDGYLTKNATDVYRRVVEQKHVLGLLPGDLTFPPGRPRVECLAILCDYNPRSTLLDRARNAALGCPFTIYVVQPDGPDYRIPPLDEWELL